MGFAPVSGIYQGLRIETTIGSIRALAPIDFECLELKDTSVLLEIGR
ncbi:hypothetical protein [Rhizobium sp. LjRoot258]